MPLPLTPHVTNYELSKRLKELGVPQKSCFYWVRMNHDWGFHLVYSDSEEGSFDIQYAEEKYSAYLASEVGEWLPPGIDEKGMVNANLNITKTYGNFWTDGYYDQQNAIEKSAYTLPDAMGEMVVYLAKEGMIKF